MRTLERNKTSIYYSYLDGEEEDEYGNIKPKMSKPKKLKASVSIAQGVTEFNPFGKLEDYDKIIMLSDMELPISEQTVFWIDTQDLDKPHDYLTKRVAKSLNSISIAVSKVKIDG